MVKQACQKRWAVAKKCECGQVSLQTALVFPSALLMLLFLAQMVLWVFADSTAQAAAEHGAETASFYDGSSALGRAEAENSIRKLSGLSDSKVEVEQERSSVTVRVTGRPLQILPLGLTVVGESTMPLEANLNIPVGR